MTFYGRSTPLAAGPWLKHRAGVFARTTLAEVSCIVAACPTGDMEKMMWDLVCLTDPGCMVLKPDFDTQERFAFCLHAANRDPTDLGRHLLPIAFYLTELAVVAPGYGDYEHLDPPGLLLCLAIDGTEPGLLDALPELLDSLRALAPPGNHDPERDAIVELARDAAKALRRHRPGDPPGALESFRGRLAELYPPTLEWPSFPSLDQARADFERKFGPLPPRPTTRPLWDRILNTLYT